MRKSLSKSRILDLQKVKRGQLCPRAYYIKHDRREEWNSQDWPATKLGKYYEQELTGYVPRGEGPVEPEVYKTTKEGSYTKGDPKGDYQLVHQCVEATKLQFDNMGLQILGAGEWFETEHFHGITDIRASISSLLEPEAIVDIKLVVNARQWDNKWDEYGWGGLGDDAPRDWQKRYHRVQAWAYSEATGLPFYYYLHKMSNPGQSRLIAVPYGEPEREQLFSDLEAAKATLNRIHEAKYPTSPSLSECATCGYAACADKADTPGAEILDLITTKEGGE